ncbi:MAG TPA: hypothetical protein VF691_15690 [Cytophagaceae bacterium]|jgi:uncharacterized membrane protein
MNLKRTFGAILTVLGIIAICYGAFVFIKNQSEWLVSLVTFGVGVLFFSSGISLVKGTKDES